MTTPYLLPDIERDEGRRLKAYRDSRGIWTIGVGHNIQADPTLIPQLRHLIDVGINDAHVMDLLVQDTAIVIKGLSLRLPWWRDLNDPRQDVFVNMAFNLGLGEFCTWSHTLGFAQQGDWAMCGHEIGVSEPWASQVGARAQRLATQMATGVRA